MTVRQQDDLIRFQEYETMIAWDDNGVEILRKDGQRFKVTFTDEEMALLLGTLFTHNHPRGLEFSDDDPRSYGNSFSEQDLRFACHAQLAELRVVTPRLRFSLKPPVGGWNADYWEDSLGPVCIRFKNLVFTEFRSAVTAGSMTVAEAEAQYFHEVCLRAATELQLPYIREES
jgi:hypothetical protein